MKSVHLIHILLIISCLSFSSFGQEGKVKQVKLSRFDLQSSTLIAETGEVISSPQYKSNVHWFPVTVPSTVLTGLVANGVYPDPYSGLNNMFIPDASDEFNKKYNLGKFSHIPGVPKFKNQPGKNMGRRRYTFRLYL